MLPIILLAAALSGAPHSVQYHAVVHADSAVFAFPVQYDTAWAVGNTAAAARTPEYEWTVSTAVGDTVFSFGYLLFRESLPGMPAGVIRFADARTRYGDRRLFVNGSMDRTAAVDVAFEASRVVIRLNDVGTIRRVFALHPQTVQFSSRVGGGLRETLDVPVVYAATALAARAAEPAPPPDELPDSTYLALVTDLPDMGSFAYDIVSRNRVVNVYTEMRNVLVTGCTLSFEVWRYFRGTTVAIPLDAIDPKSLNLRVQHPPRGAYRLDPQPWSLHVAIKRDAKARIMVGTTETRHKAATYDVDVDIENHIAALQVADWLRDAGNRCASWKTGPLKPIR